MFSKLYFKVFNRPADRCQHSFYSVPGRRAVKIFLLAFFVLLFVGAKHEYHASVTQMQYNAKERVFEVSIRMFTDDLEKTLTKENGGQRVMFDKKYEKINDQLLEKYIRKHFSVTTPQKQIKSFNYVGHETEADAQWVYIELPYAEPFRGGILQQSVLMDTFDDQVNLVTVNYNTQKKTFLFRKNQTVQEISL